MAVLGEKDAKQERVLLESRNESSRAFSLTRNYVSRISTFLWQGAGFTTLATSSPIPIFFTPPPLFLSLSLLFLQCHCPTFFCSSHESHVCTFTFGNFFLFLISPFALFKTRLGDGVYLWNFFWNRGPKLWNLQLQIANPCKALAINCNRITDCVRPISFASTRRYLTFQDSKSFFF